MGAEARQLSEELDITSVLVDGRQHIERVRLSYKDGGRTVVRTCPRDMFFTLDRCALLGPRAEDF